MDGHLRGEREHQGSGILPLPRRISRDVTEAIGQVPTVRLNRLGAACKSHDLFLKLESCNPGGSIKEKNAAYLVKDAEKRGLLRRGGTIVEASSGNFGIGLAMLGAARGYRVIIVVDAKTPPATRRMLALYGAEIVDIPLSEADRNGSMLSARMKKAREVAGRTPGAWYPCQHRNPMNPDAHAVHTAREIERDFEGAPDVIVVGISTAGQVAGLAKFFGRNYPEVRFVGVDVAGSAILGTPQHPYKLSGLGASFVPPSFDARALAAGYSIPDALAFSVCHELVRKEGLLLGGSTGAIVAAGLAYARSCRGRNRILMINPDRGERYLDTIYNTEWLSKQNVELMADSALERGILALKPVFVREESITEKVRAREER